jgi:hypothetical protein
VPLLIIVAIIGVIKVLLLIVYTSLHVTKVSQISGIVNKFPVTLSILEIIGVIRVLFVIVSTVFLATRVSFCKEIGKLIPEEPVFIDVNVTLVNVLFDKVYIEF